MAKYTTVVLKVRNRELIGIDDLSNDILKALKYNAAIYIYQGTSSKKVYIGQTVHFIERHSQHYSGSEEKFNTAHFNRVIVIFSRLFNGSSLDDVESQLITYFNADNPSNRVGYDDEIINRTGGNTVIEYEGRESVSSDVVLPLWEKVLYPGGWVKTPTLDELRTRALVKYSPIKILTKEQTELITEVIANPTKNYLINGDAGTGKTVLLTHMVGRILRERKDAVVGVVVQPNWEKTGREIFDIFGMKDDARLTISTSTKLIKEGKVFDVILVDEVLQAIRPANVPRAEFARLTVSYEKRFLKTQFRIQPPRGKCYSSEDYMNGIKWLLYKDTGLLQSGFTNFDPMFNKEVFSDHTPNAYFGYFDSSPLHQMIDWLEDDMNLNPEHVDRVLAGLVERWKQSDGSNPEIKHFIEGDVHRRWNSTQTNWININDPDAEEQIGSVFAVQGLDLNKVGVLIGNDLKVENGRLKADPNNFHNVNGKFNADEMINPSNQFEFTLFVLNIYYVLLTRGIDGIRVGFWHNDAFREYMINTLNIV